MAYDFEVGYDTSMLAEGTQLIKHPVWGGNINGYTYGDGRMIEVRALVVHTPEEDADDHEGTPLYFAKRGVRRSTHDYIDNDGDLYQLVADEDAAWGQGTGDYNRVFKGQYQDWAPWNPEHISNNQLSKGVEVEGRAITIHRTLTRAQYSTIARWMAWNTTRYNITMDRIHILGHYELSTDKTDPGRLPLDDLVESARMLVSNNIAVHPNLWKRTEEGMTGLSHDELSERFRLAWRRGREEAQDRIMMGFNKGLQDSVRSMLQDHTDAYVSEQIEDLLP
jgi:hypothetical protein